MLNSVRGANSLCLGWQKCFRALVLAFKTSAFVISKSRPPPRFLSLPASPPSLSLSGMRLTIPIPYSSHPLRPSPCERQKERTPAWIINLPSTMYVFEFCKQEGGKNGIPWGSWTMYPIEMLGFSKSGSPRLLLAFTTVLFNKFTRKIIVLSFKDGSRKPLGQLTKSSPSRKGVILSPPLPSLHTCRPRRMTWGGVLQDSYHH